MHACEHDRWAWDAAGWRRSGALSRAGKEGDVCDTLRNTLGNETIKERKKKKKRKVLVNFYVLFLIFSQCEKDNLWDSALQFNIITNIWFNEKLN